jgi:hypothetical protein
LSDKYTQTIKQSNNQTIDFMKKTILAVVALLCLCGTAAAQRHMEYKWRGFYAVVDGAYVMNLNRSVDQSGFSDTVSGPWMGVSAGFQFRKEAGVGAGFAYLYDPNGAYTQLPVFVELRSHLLRSRLTPYFAVQGGYALPVGSSSPTAKITTGGLYFGAEFGGRYAIERGFAIGLRAGYKFINMAEVTRYEASGIFAKADPNSLHLVNVGLSLYF